MIWFGGGVIKPAFGYVRHLGLRQPDEGHCDQPGEASFLTGCCLLIKREVIEKVGLLDEGFYLYSEDADYCLRAAKTGYKLYYEPRSRIYHKVSRSTGGAYNLKKWFRRYQSLWRLVRKHTSPITYPLFLLNVLFELLTLPLNALLQTLKLKR
ncbi:MAG: glycosyltransferase family 2 protein [bacterium]